MKKTKKKKKSEVDYGVGKGEWVNGNQTHCCMKYAGQPYQQIPAHCLRILPALRFYWWWSAGTAWVPGCLSANGKAPQTNSDYSVR